MIISGGMVEITWAAAMPNILQDWTGLRQNLDRQVWPLLSLQNSQAPHKAEDIQFRSQVQGS